MLTGAVAERLKEIFAEIASNYDLIIEKQEVVGDHVHLFLSAPPRYAPARVVNILKSISAKTLRREIRKEIRKYLWEDKFWCDGYFVSTVNDSTTAQQIKKYIENQKEQLKQLRLLNLRALGNV